MSKVLVDRDVLHQAVDPVAEVESTFHGAGGFHCRLLAYTMPPVGAKLYTTPPDTEALLHQARATAIQSCIDRLIFGGQPAAAQILRHHFGVTND